MTHIIETNKESENLCITNGESWSRQIIRNIYNPFSMRVYFIGACLRFIRHYLQHMFWNTSHHQASILIRRGIHSGIKNYYNISEHIFVVEFYNGWILRASEAKYGEYWLKKGSITTDGKGISWYDKRISQWSIFLLNEALIIYSLSANLTSEEAIQSNEINSFH